MKERRTQRSFSLVECIIALSLVVLFYVLGALLSQKRALDQDEFLHLHASWYMFQGFLPYRDYFDHYTPLFQLFLVPLFHFFKVDVSFADAIASIFLARKFMWLISGIILLLTFSLGRLLRGPRVGYVAVLFLLCTEAYWSKTLEIRPDGLATVFCLFYFIMAVHAIQRQHNDYVRTCLFTSSGFFLALAFLAIQKVVYVFPGVGVGACWYVLSSPDDSARRHRLTDVVYQLLGFCVPILLTAGYFYLQQGLPQFIAYNFLFHIGSKGFAPYGLLHQSLYQHPFLGLFSIAGLLCSLRLCRQSWFSRGDLIVVPSTLALITGVFLIPVPEYQYYILFLPFLAIFGADFLLESVDELVDSRERIASVPWILLASLISISMLGYLFLLGRGAGSHWPLYLILGYWFGVLLGFMTLIFKRAPAAALIVFLVAMSVGPLIRLQNTVASPRSTPQFEEMRYIIENTSPSDTIMDGYQGSGVYRPHAYFFWFLAYKEREKISGRDKQHLLENLHDGSIAPQLILFDAHLRGVSAGITEFFQNNYEPVGTGVIWRRKE